MSAPHTSGESGGLRARYGAVLRHAWASRHQLAGPARQADEIAFLPAALSLQDTPTHPAPRRLAWLLMSLFTAALAWTVFGQVDIVAVAPGRIIVPDRTKIIQPLEASVVTAVLVKDGDLVKAGQVLIELDPTLAAADTANLQEQMRAASSEQQRAAALLQQLGRPTPSGPATLPGPGTQGLTPEVATQLLSEWQDISAKLSRLEATLALRQAEIATVRQTAAKLEATLPMSRTREADYQQLVSQGFISGHATQDKTRERTELEQDLQVQRARQAETQANAREAEQAKAAFITETRRLLHDRLAQASSKMAQLKAEQTKAGQRERMTRLRAPVDGVVQQLAVHSVGGVVTTAQPLMVVVPEGAGLSAEISIANLDIGFVQAGQPAVVKLETFAYTRYGTVDATVSLVTADAVTDDKKGSYYPATLKLSQQDMLIDGRRVRLSPGMNITAEIKTGQRRIIEYLLSPVQRAGSESLRER